MTLLHVGAAAPMFQTEDIFAAPIQLSMYAGRPLLLSFFRNAACAICNLRVHQLIQQYPVYHKQGLEILAVFESPHSSIRQYVGRQDAPFPIIADPQAQLYTLYGVETSAEKIAQSMEMAQTQQIIQEAAAQGFALTPEAGSNFHRMPADFLIAPDQTLYEAHYAQHVTDHLSLDMVEQFIAAFSVA